MDITYKELYVYTGHLVLWGLRNGGNYYGLGMWLESILLTFFHFRIKYHIYGLTYLVQ